MQNIDYGKIIKRSWEITWKNKWLWVTGMVLAAFGSSGSSGGGGSSGSTSSQSIPSSSPLPSPVEIKDKTSYVLGAATDYIKNWFSNVPVQNWILLGLLILFLVIVGVCIVWVLTHWAKGALIQGFEDADNDKLVTLKSISPYGISNVKKLIIFSLISVGMSIFVLVSLTLFVGLGYLAFTLFKPVGTILLILFGILAFLVFIASMAIFTMVTIYAERLIVLKGFAPWQAWKKGFSLSKGNFMSTLLMGIINSIIGATTGCLGVIVLLIVFAIPGFLLIYPIFKDGFKIPSLMQIFGILIFILLFFSINTMLRAVFIVFNYGNWNIFFKEIINKEGEVING